MNKNQKILLGVLSFIPLICLIIGFGYYFSFIFSMIDASATGNNSQMEFSEGSKTFLKVFVPFLVSIIIASFIGIGLLIYFIIAAIKDASATENDRILWVLLLVFLSYIIYPVYWYVRIWSNPNFAISTKKDLAQNIAAS
jgi:hypothetical protein